ncbi:hypothetical protein MO973_03105 [Paenibacillus sp. TRM 82003]|nr:hypothetical protein [Paenibacillus sp. TRM 82003]
MKEAQERFKLEGWRSAHYWIRHKNFEQMDSVTKEFTDQESIRIITQAINGAEKLAGAVNVVDPHYKIELREEAYFLWLY